MEAWVRKTGRLPPRKVRRQWEKQWRKEAQRSVRAAQKAQREASSWDPARAAVFGVMGLVFTAMAMSDRRIWWMLFIALGFFLTAAKHAKRPALEEKQGLPESEGAKDVQVAPPRAQPEPAAQPRPREEEDPRTAKVDALCTRLLTELRQGPSVLREVVHAPERTVEALRKGCHALVRRERELRALVTPEEARRLESERETLSARVEAEKDAVVRERLKGALTALDSQRAQRAELATAADRLEAEHMRLYYTLEGLYAQVLRVRSADAAGEDIAGLGLRQSVEQLGAEVEAVTEALEEAHRPHDGRVRTR
ncbi:hypothetical protein [Myxococcus stipitatus]|uniref:hypothetical protein n=1 Tax=Myxococcus stipitatus TaxID=83455 RepID=UPI001E32FFE2|nr:hypothetical protein [Myxococcus stipitatus]